MTDRPKDEAPPQPDEHHADNTAQAEAASPASDAAEVKTHAVSEPTEAPPPTDSRPAHPAAVGDGEGTPAAVETAPALDQDRWKRGPLAWMTRNSVAANLLMGVLLLGGALIAPNIKQEVFPEVETDAIQISVPFPGSTPDEVAAGVVVPIEEAVRGIDGVKHVRATATESSASITVELYTSADRDRALDDVQNAFDRITTFPGDVERDRATVSLVSMRSQVISVVIAGDISESALRKLGDKVREDLLAMSTITTVDLTAVRPPEISVEVPQEKLRWYGLSFEEIARKIGQSSVEIGAGGVKTDAGELLLRVRERRAKGSEFEDIVLLSQPDGSEVLLSDVATVIDGFRETDQEAFFNGVRAVRVVVYRVGDQKPLEIAEAVKEYVAGQHESLPAGVMMETLEDRSEMYADRMSLLTRNGVLGLVLVLLVLGLFLDLRLAFWVTMGIPISFLGSLLVIPLFDVSINMISLFAFIVTLGIVVDDAIVVGESVYKHRQDGKPRLRAAIDGVREVAAPVVFSVLTTIVAFMPLLFVPGTMGKIFRVIPVVVISVLAISLVESLFVLPAHLSHLRQKPTGVFGFVHGYQQAIARFVERVIERVYVPSVRVAIAARYFAAAASIALLIATVGYVGSGRLPFTFMPKVEGDRISVNIRMPFGTSVEDTRAAQARVVHAASAALEELGGADVVARGVYAEVGSAPASWGPSGAASSGSHLAQVVVYMKRPEERSVTTGDVVKLWREKVGEIPGVDSLMFDYTTGPSGGTPIDVELSHPDSDTLEAAAMELALALQPFAGVTDIDSGVARGKQQLELKLKPEARSLGLSESGLGRQLRAAFYGAEATRQTRQRDELRVFVRQPESERRSEADLEEMIVLTPQGGELPLRQAVEATRSRSYTSIVRKDARRVLSVTADIVPGVTTSGDVLGELTKTTLPKLVERHPGLGFDLAGEREAQAETFAALKEYYVFALLVMFTLMAVAFRSYVQPIIIMIAIPFGVVGAIAGHIIMGFGLSVISMMGIVALSGVVVNDSLVLISAVNDYRAQGLGAYDAIVQAASRRFRPIMLTTATTFFGLMPMILETSVQARFLIPMAISLGFGVLFTTYVILVLVPAVYMIFEDVRRLGWWLRVAIWGPPETDAGTLSAPANA